jgi:dienelactone hydrolase
VVRPTGRTRVPEDDGGLAERLSALLRWDGPPPSPGVAELSSTRRDGYTEQRVRYVNAEEEPVEAFLLKPDAGGSAPGVVVFHQHNGEWHLGKSEVAGLAGDPSQALGPLLARRGFAVLAPDAACFEDRRRNGRGTCPRAGDRDQHYNEMAYRLVQGSLLMSLVVADAALAVSVLAATEGVEANLVGALGHSMGGHTVLFAAALDERIRFACASGAACSYRARIATGTGIEVAQVIPGVLTLTDFDGLVSLIAPRPCLIVSATEDPYSHDAPTIVAEASHAYEKLGARGKLDHLRYVGAHALSTERVDAMIQWMAAAQSDRGGDAAD